MTTSNDPWKMQHEELQAIMRQELDSLRTILNLLTDIQIETAPHVQKEKKSELTTAQKELKALQKKRSQATKALTGSSEYEKHSDSLFADALSKDLENGAETLSLWAQIISLIEKIEIATLDTASQVQPAFAVKKAKQIKRVQTIE